MTLLTMIVKMGEGLSKTCAIFFLTLLFSLPLGMIVALLRMSKNRIVSGITRFFISILRGTPLMLQLLAVTYGPDYLCDLPVARNKLIPVVIAFAINYAAYFAEIYRGGIESMPVGQYEAAEVLGYTKAQTFIHVILPHHAQHHQRSGDAGEGHLHGVHCLLSGDVHHRQADRQLRDQLYAVPGGRRVLLRVQRRCGSGHGQGGKAYGLLQIREAVA